MHIIDSIYIIITIMLIGVSSAFLYQMKEIRVLIVWSIALTAAQITVAYMHLEIKYYVLSALPFYFSVLIYTFIKIRLRINATLKRIDESEREEEKQSAQEAKLMTSPTVTEDSHGQ